MSISVSPIRINLLVGSSSYVPRLYTQYECLFILLIAIVSVVLGHFPSGYNILALKQKKCTTHFSVPSSWPPSSSGHQYLVLYIGPITLIVS